MLEFTTNTLTLVGLGWGCPYSFVSATFAIHTSLLVFFSVKIVWAKMTVKCDQSKGVIIPWTGIRGYGVVHEPVYIWISKLP